jgi:hypothetical protein
MDPHPELLHHQPKQLLKLPVIGFSVENPLPFYTPSSRHRYHRTSRERLLFFTTNCDSTSDTGPPRKDG